MKQVIDLYCLIPNTTGGWITYTAHLMSALRAVGLEPRLFKCKGAEKTRTEKHSRDFGYGERYKNIRLDDALRRKNPKLIVAAAKQYQEETSRLLDAGAKIIIHDPTEFKNLPNSLDPSRVVVIRKVGLEHVPGATCILHPYQRMTQPANVDNKSVRAVSTSRIDFDKHTDILLRANRVMDPKIHIHGFENRLYTRFKICPEFPEWEQSKAAYPRDRDAAFKLLLNAEFMVDMSIIKNDGGGTQYTTLEAWDAYAVPIIHADWIRDNDEMVHMENCLVVANADELVETIQLTDMATRAFLRENGERCLKLHAPALIGAQYAQFLLDD
jgi:hypothetical protein